MSFPDYMPKILPLESALTTENSPKMLPRKIKVFMKVEATLPEPSPRMIYHGIPLDEQLHDSPIISRRKRKKQFYFESKYKTVLCSHYMNNGKCSYDTKCQYAHGITDLRQVAFNSKLGGKTPCQSYHKQGYCNLGAKCTHLHGEVTLKKLNKAAIFVPCKRELYFKRFLQTGTEMKDDSNSYEQNLLRLAAYYRNPILDIKKVFFFNRKHHFERLPVFLKITEAEKLRKTKRKTTTDRLS